MQSEYYPHIDCWDLHSDCNLYDAVLDVLLVRRASDKTVENRAAVQNERWLKNLRNKIPEFKFRFPTEADHERFSERPQLTVGDLVDSVKLPWEPTDPIHCLDARHH